MHASHQHFADAVSQCHLPPAIQQALTSTILVMPAALHVHNILKFTRGRIHMAGSGSIPRDNGGVAQHLLFNAWL